VAAWAWSWARSRWAWRAARRIRRSARSARRVARASASAGGGALRLRVREPLAVPVAGELGELVHGGHLLPGGGGACLCSTVAAGLAGAHT
jgi:hypothetical protein